MYCKINTNVMSKWAQKDHFSPELREERRKAYAEAKKRCEENRERRVIFYVVSATKEQHEHGESTYSEPYQIEGNARVYAERVRKTLGNHGHVAIEKHHEKKYHGSWEIDHDNGGSEHVDYL